MPGVAHSQTRNLAFDRARTFLTLLVLLHHAAIPYTHFGHTDPKSWLGFDFIVLANDSFFMAAFFFLSGLFVWPGLKKKGALVYLRERFLRLGVPFVVCALTLIPLAYYALALRQSPELSFFDFWWRTVTEGPWPSGPAWFLWVLFSFDVLASALYIAAPKLTAVTIARFQIYLFAIGWLVYIPLLIYFGASRWFEFGPLAVQASRLLFYLTYFFIGAGAGSLGIMKARLPDDRWKWSLVSLSSYSLLWLMIYIKRVILENQPVLPWWYPILYGSFVAVFSASILLTILGFCLNADSTRRNFIDRIQGETYGIFLVHYPIALWIQYFLFNSGWPAILKGSVSFVATMFISWSLTVALRKIPGAKRVL